MTALAHGGTAGLVVEAGLVLVLLVLGVRVWRQSKSLDERSDAAPSDDEAAVEERERKDRPGRAEAEERVGSPRP